MSTFLHVNSEIKFFSVYAIPAKALRETESRLLAYEPSPASQLRVRDKLEPGWQESNFAIHVFGNQSPRLGRTQSAHICYRCEKRNFVTHKAIKA